MHNLLIQINVQDNYSVPPAHILNVIVTTLNGSQSKNK